MQFGTSPQIVRLLSEHSYLILVTAYASTLWAFCLATGSLATGLLTTVSLVSVPLLGILGKYRRRARPWLALVMIGVSYQAISGPIDAIADTNGILSMFGFDRQLWGFNLTGWVQSTFFSAPLTEATSLVYVAMVPFVLLTALVIWRRGGRNFASFVAAMVLTSYFALVTFVLLPTAPPWVSGVASNLVRTTGLGTLPGFLAPISAFMVPDYFASFPSLHAAYTIIAAYFLFKTDTRLGLVGAAIAGATLFSTLYLGQHFAIDLIGGAVYALVPCVLAERLSRRYLVGRTGRLAGVA